jgi:uncharacterized DUF497 family protein
LANDGDELEFQWDPEKASSNLKKHRVSFLTATAIFKQATVESMDDSEDYGEERWIALGAVGSRLYQVVYTWRGEHLMRIISARRANENEREDYFRAVYDERDPSDAGSRRR